MMSKEDNKKSQKNNDNNDKNNTNKNNKSTNSKNTNNKNHFNNLLAWMQRKGFVWGPSPEIYGGTAGFYDYAPLGKLLKNNVEEAIRKTFTKNNFWEVECPIIMPRIVWEASGHLQGFTDPIISDEKGNTYRADNLIEEQLQKQEYELNGKKIIIDGAKPEELLAIIKDAGIKAPNGSKLIMEIKQHNLMMKTTTGIDNESYNRPETATTTYLPFSRYVNFFRDKLPFGVFQIGKAFRNEISPRQHILRQREFTQAEGQLFIFKSQKNNYPQFEKIKQERISMLAYDEEKKEYFAYNYSTKEETYNNENPLTMQEAIEKGILKNKAYAWTLNLAYNLFIEMGIPREKIRMRQHEPEKKAFYAEDAWDVEIKLNSFGWTEVCGVHDRTDYDLKQHSKYSKEKMEAINPETGKKETPHVLEIAFGTDRPTFALMDLYYEYDEEKKQDVFKIPARMAPVKTAVFSLVKKENLPVIAEEINNELKEEGIISITDHSGSIGRRYARQDEIGTPYCITIDFETKEEGTVTIRERDSTKQIRKKKEEVTKYIKELLSGKQKFPE